MMIIVTRVNVWRNGVYGFFGFVKQNAVDGGCGDVFAGEQFFDASFEVFSLCIRIL